MGRGNVCVSGTCEGLFFIDNVDFHVYHRDKPFDEGPEVRLLRDVDYAELTAGDWLYDEYGTMEEESDVLECFMDDFCRMFPSFQRAEADEWLRNGPWDSHSHRVLLESKLFYICVEDNEWSLAVELIQKEDDYGSNWMENLQRRLFEKYLEGMKIALLNRLPGIGTYQGAWMSGRIKREEVLV